jgi:sulfur transfer complex TusBCD TusB component (DsrH family)
MPYRAKLENVARFFGQTGQYPYAAMSHIAVDIAPSDPLKVGRILRDATRYFQRDPGFISTNQEFVRFILATRNIASPKILRKELMVATTALQQQPRTFKNRTYRVSMTTPRGTAAFGSQNEALLFQLLPLMKISVPKIAAELLERYPSLRLAPEITVDTPIAYAGSVSLGGTADPARMQSALDEGRAFKVQMMAASDPATALSIAQQITDSTLRHLAQVSLVPAYARVHPEQANAWLADAQSMLPSISDAGKKLRLMSAVALAQIKLGKYSEAIPWIAQVFALAEDLFMRERRQNPSEPSYALTGYDELSDLTENLSETAAQQSSLIARIETVSDEVLRARLLTAFAKAALHESALHHID